MLLEPGVRLGLQGWLFELTPMTTVLYLLLAIGLLVAVFGVVALIRRGEQPDR